MNYIRDKASQIEKKNQNNVQNFYVDKLKLSIKHGSNWWNLYGKKIVPDICRKQNPLCKTQLAVLVYQNGCLKSNLLAFLKATNNEVVEIYNAPC